MTVSTEPKPESPAELAAEHIKAAHARKDAAYWLLDLMGEHDFTVPQDAFEAICEKLAALATIQASAAPLARPVSGEAWQQLVKLAQAEFAFPDLDFDGSPDIPAWAVLVHQIAAPTSTPSSAKKD